MELHDNIFNVNGNENFERYEDQPIVPDMVSPVAIYQNNLMEMSDDRRESNFSLQSDISIGTTTESDNSLPHLKYFRTPSVVVSDHSEDTGCVTYDDITRIHNAYNRKRRTKTGRRHSVDANDQFEYSRRTDSMVSGSTANNNSSADFYKSSENASPVPRRKIGGYRDGRKSLSLDEGVGEFELGADFDRKTLSECSSSNELSPIMSQCGSSNFSEGSSRSSVYSEISPVFLRKNMSFTEIQKRAPNADPNPKEDKNNVEFGSYFQSRETSALDDGDFFLLERQRSLSYDDLCVDSSVTSDVSYTDLSTDLSACSSLSNLVGTVYYNSYDPNQDYGFHYLRKPNSKSKSDKIKTSKSCSDFLSVNRIAEDYPHLRHRRHSNDQVAVDVSKKNGSRDGSKKKWLNMRHSPTRCANVNRILRASDSLGARMKHALERLIALRLKSFHESLNFQKENYLLSDRKSKSNESIFVDSKKETSTGRGTACCTVKIIGCQTDNVQEKASSSTEKESSIVENNDTNVSETKKEWLSVQWNGDCGGYSKGKMKGRCENKDSSRKISDCSTCSTNSEDHQNSNVVDAKTKTSGWRKLRNIVQWTPFFQTYKKQRYPWVQLAGHQGNFKAGPEQGTILKKLCPKEEKCYKILMKDALRPYVPEYKGQVTCDESECIYLQLQDLLVDFTSPCVLDCKLGVRTYLEEELQKAKEKPKLRKDMYEKMIQVDPTAPTLEEHRLKAVTKPRYMIWRETISSTSTLGFRLEGVRKSDGKSSKDFKTTRTKEEVKEAFRDFVNGFPHAVPKYVQRLKAIKGTLEVSIFFSSHEVIGSSLLFVHDQVKANVWLIDFAKTLMLPEHTFIDHKSQWEVGNHEDGYLTGIINLIEIFSELEEEQNSKRTPQPEETNMGTTATTSPTSKSPEAINSTDET